MTSRTKWSWFSIFQCPRIPVASWSGRALPAGSRVPGSPGQAGELVARGKGVRVLARLLGVETGPALIELDSLFWLPGPAPMATLVGRPASWT